MTRLACERSVQKRFDYRQRISKYDPTQLVFVDESACDRRTTYRGRAWSIKGTKAVRKAHFVRGKRCEHRRVHFEPIERALTSFRYSILPALSLDGMIHCHIIEGSFDTAGFTEFIEGLLDHMQPYPGPNSVIVMDNCRIHHSDILLELIKDR